MNRITTAEVSPDAAAGRDSDQSVAHDTTEAQVIRQPVT
jgi:hypothetical protein